MNALRYTQKGALENLRLAQVPKPTLSPGEVLIKVKGAGINSSDSAAILGELKFATVPRIPGRDYSGQVVEVADASAKEWIGAEVWGSLTEFRGFLSDGSFAEYLKMNVSHLSRKPKTLDHIQAASMGLVWLCAWIAVQNSSTVKAGNKALVIGARGGIGSAVTQILHDKGVKSIYGTYRTSPASVPSYVTPIVLVNDTSISDHLKETGDLNAIDVLIDCAGYEVPLNDAIKGMKTNGQVVVMAVERSDGLFLIDLRSFYVKALSLKGLSSGSLNGVQAKELFDYLAGKFDDGSFKGSQNVGQVEMKDEEAVHKALKNATSRSGRRVVIVPT